MNRLKGLMCGMISSSTFGLIPLFALPVIRAGVGIDSVMFYRFAISALVLGGWLSLRGHDLKISLKEALAVLGLGVFYAMTALLLTKAYLYIPSGVATTIHFLYPVVVAAVMILFFKDRMSLPLVMAACMAIAGVYMLSGGGSTGTAGMKGVMLALTTVVAYAFYIVGVNKSWAKEMDGLKLTFYVLLACSLVFGLNLLVKGQPLEMVPDVQSGINLVFLALIPTLVSDFTLILSVQQVGSTTTAVLGCMEPLAAVSMGILFLGEHIGLMQGVGIAVILLAVIVVILANGPQGFPFKKLIPQIIRIRRNNK